MKKKVKLELKCSKPDYVVVRVTNSTEWSPADTLAKAKVDSLLYRPDLTVVISG